MRSPPVGGVTFDASVCLFDAIGFAVTDDGVAATLKGVASALRAGGVFVLEFWNANALRKSFAPTLVRRIADGGEELVRISDSCLDPASGVLTVSYDLLALHPDRTFERHRETQRNRGFDVDEMRALLDAAGFVRVRFQAGYGASPSIGDDDWHIVGVSERAA
jgi:hypothetical protein